MNEKPTCGCDSYNFTVGEDGHTYRVHLHDGVVSYERVSDAWARQSDTDTIVLEAAGVALKLRRDP